MSSTQKHPAALEHHENVDPDEIRAVEETFGTIVVAKEADARQMLRPQPSLDPNDPLVGQPTDNDAHVNVYARRTGRCGKST